MAQSGQSQGLHVIWRDEVAPIQQGMGPDHPHEGDGATGPCPDGDARPLRADLALQPLPLDPARADAASAEKAPKMKMTAPADAGRIMIDGIEADKARVFVGKDAAIMDKLVRFMPVKSGEIIYSQMKSILPK